ncbi:TIGR03086 family metal-binding protein [Phytoactinopolyspora endophytica]|uniref:TIGR03086 family metal-binding protein n=1 Tax=Phytoactinopolyspora endophytica TaxID=1642495 RepID=UPI00101C9EEA|nr:TIGR03086 family metal-binding protein [Phytoactinopolyspora endophytica]
MLNLEPATRMLADLVQGIGDDQLSAPTPCSETSLGDLLDHVDGLSLAFAAAAAKTPLDGGSQGPSADVSCLGSDWRRRIPERLEALGKAWHEESAWTGMTEAGGVEMPGEVAGLVVLDEVVVHGWDVAVASGQAFTCEPDLLQAVHEFVEASVAENPQGSPGLFGPPVPVGRDAPLLERVIGLTGREPSWRRPSSDGR